MAPKKKFTKQQIIDAAFEIARNEGISQITIRKVAEHLGSSIAPIYVNFKSVEELTDAVTLKIVEVSQQILMEESSGNPFHDIGVASLRFAREYPQLFWDLIQHQNKLTENYDENMGDELIQQMKGDEHLKGLSDEELMNILLKMRIFTTGLSIMVAGGLLPKEFSEEMGVELLDSMARDVVMSAYLRKQDE